MLGNFADKEITMFGKSDATRMLAAFMSVMGFASAMQGATQGTAPRQTNRVLGRWNGEPLPCCYPGAKLARKALTGKCGIRYT